MYVMCDNARGEQKRTKEGKKEKKGDKQTNKKCTTGMAQPSPSQNTKEKKKEKTGYRNVRTLSQVAVTFSTAHGEGSEGDSTRGLL